MKRIMKLLFLKWIWWFFQRISLGGNRTKKAALLKDDQSEQMKILGSLDNIIFYIEHAEVFCLEAYGDGSKSSCDNSLR